MILHFSKGLLQLRSGETLRLYMSKKLFCDPMRITKRFAGTLLLLLLLPMLMLFLLLPVVAHDLSTSRPHVCRQTR
jgi:hypothetical protein